MRSVLPSNIDEAAILLARRAVASRLAAGFVKQAAGPDIQAKLQSIWNAVKEKAPEFWADTQAQVPKLWKNPAIRNAILGAGIGGSSGLLLNQLTGARKRKSPWASLLSGAGLGAALGGGYGAVSKYWPEMTRSPHKEEAAAALATKAHQQHVLDEAAKKGPLAVLSHMVLGTDPPDITMPTAPTLSDEAKTFAKSIVTHPGAPVGGIAGWAAGKRIPGWLAGRQLAKQQKAFNRAANMPLARLNALRSSEDSLKFPPEAGLTTVEKAEARRMYDMLRQTAATPAADLARAKKLNRMLKYLSQGKLQGRNARIAQALDRAVREATPAFEAEVARPSALRRGLWGTLGALTGSYVGQQGENLTRDLLRKFQ